MRLKDKVAIITGSSKGIGFTTALTFAREGAKVVVCGSSQENADKAVKELLAQLPEAQAIGFKANVTDRAEIDAMVAAVKEKWGKVDILVNNAGITADAMLRKMTEEQFDKVIDVNLKGVFNCTKAVLEIMLEQGSGSIVNCSSVVGIYGNIGQTNYAAAKWGVIGMTKSWAKELGRKGIRVNAVAPGYTHTSMMDTVPENILKALAEKTPLQRLGKPEDIANAYLYLASDEAAFVTGTTLCVDGGLVI